MTIPISQWDVASLALDDSVAIVVTYEVLIFHMKYNYIRIL
jgi:hypothetical protein